MMAIAWIAAIKSGTSIKKALSALIAPGAYRSKTVWYNLIKTAFTLAAALGIYVGLADEDVETISTAVAAAVAVVTVAVDSVASIWLRKKTTMSLEDLKQVADEMERRHDLVDKSDRRFIDIGPTEAKLEEKIDEVKTEGAA